VHGSVLQNKKYIKFADDNTVEVMVLSRLDEGIEKEDKRAATYKGKDENGNEIELLVGYPNLTVEDIKGMLSTKAGSYNNTGKIPYTAIVNPHTLEEMENIKGGYGAGTLVDLVKEKKKELEKEHGKSISRKDLEKVKKSSAEIHEMIDAGDLTRALSDCAKLEKSVAKSPALLEMAGKVAADVQTACAKQLDELEAQIARGETKDAAKELGPLARALKGTPLEERANTLLEQTKAA